MWKIGCLKAIAMDRALDLGGNCLLNEERKEGLFFLGETDSLLIVLLFRYGSSNLLCSSLLCSSRAHPSVIHP